LSIRLYRQPFPINLDTFTKKNYLFIFFAKMSKTFPLNHYEDRAIILHLLKNHPKRFFKVHEEDITAKIRCRLLHVGLIQQIDNTMTHLFEGLRCAVETRIQQKDTLSSTKKIVEEELNKLLDNDLFLLDNSIPLLIFKYREDILKLTKQYSRSKFVILNHSFRRRVYHALHTELTELRAYKNTLSASIGMILKATVSSDWLHELSNQEDIKLLHDYDNRLVEKYQPVIQIKTQRLIDSSEMTKEDIRSDVILSQYNHSQRYIHCLQKAVPKSRDRVRITQA